MTRLWCLLGRHRAPASIFGMNESRASGETRVLAGFRCACGALVTQRATSWRNSKRALKREIVTRRAS